MNEKLDPYKAPSSALERSAEIQKTPFFKSWLMFFIVATIGGFAAGAGFGGVAGFTLGSMGESPETIETAGTIIGFVIAIPISYFSFKWAVSKYILCI